MHERFKHVNSVGAVMQFGSKILVNYNNVRDFQWSVKSENEKIIGFEKGMASKTIPFIINCTEAEADKFKNEFFEHFEIDVLNEKPGYFEINGYRFYCYAIKNKKSNYLLDKGYLELNVEFTSDQPNWIKETSYTLSNSKTMVAESAVTDIKKYPYKYPYIYGDTTQKLQILNNALGLSNVIIRMFGPTSNPFVNIGGVVYKMNASCLDNEYIEINTEKRTIYKHTESGEKVNLFNSRSKETSDFFAKIPSGILNVIASEMTSAEIVVLEKRSEPKWI